MVTQGQLPALGSCHPLGLSRAARGVETEKGQQVGSPTLPFPQPRPVCCLGALKLPSHLSVQALPTSPGVLKPGSGP